MKFRKSFTFFQKILSAVYTFLFCLFSIVAANRCFPTCYKEFVAIYVVVSPGFIPPNLCDVYPHYTDFVRPIFFFWRRLLYQISFSLPASCTHLQLEIYRSHYVTSIHKWHVCQIYHSWEPGLYIACMIGQQCMFSFWFGTGTNICLL